MERREYASPFLSNDMGPRRTQAVSFERREKVRGGRPQGQGRQEFPFASCAATKEPPLSALNHPLGHVSPSFTSLFCYREPRHAFRPSNQPIAAFFHCEWHFQPRNQLSVSCAPLGRRNFEYENWQASTGAGRNGYAGYIDSYRVNTRPR